MRLREIPREAGDEPNKRPAMSDSRFRSAYAHHELQLAELTRARAELRLAENELSEALGYRVPLRGPALMAVLKRSAAA